MNLTTLQDRVQVRDPFGGGHRADRYHDKLHHGAPGKAGQGREPPIMPFTGVIPCTGPWWGSYHYIEEAEAFMSDPYG